MYDPKKVSNVKQCKTEQIKQNVKWHACGVSPSRQFIYC